MNRLDGLLRENEEILERSRKRAKQRKKMDDNVFDFVDDSTPEVTRPRINETSPTVMIDEEDDSERILDGNDSGIETNSEQVALNQEPAVVNETEAEAGPFAAVGHEEPDKEEKNQFYAHVDFAHRENNPNLSGEIKTGIELMDMLNKKGGSLEMHECLSQWHVKNSSSKDFVSADGLHRFLVKRHGLENLLPKEKTVELPHSKEKVDIATHSFNSMLSNLLTDPRIEDKHYLFFDDNPHADMPPETDNHVIGDINTGRAYRETYKTLIEPDPWVMCDGVMRQKVLSPMVMYLAANWGHLEPKDWRY